jgi:rRNA-processing protein FCF1
MAFDRLWRNPEKRVILDSNAILMLFEFSIDLESELTRLIGKNRIIIPEPILRELVFLSKKGKGQKKVNAKAALKLIKDYDIVEIDTMNADESVFLLAKKLNAIVVTNDRELRDRLKKNSISVVYLRGKQRLELE